MNQASIEATKAVMEQVPPEVLDRLVLAVLIHIQEPPRDPGDWRPECQKITDKIEHYQRCSSDAIILHADGRLVQRHDGCSVVFLKRPVIIDSEEA